MPRDSDDWIQTFTGKRFWPMDPDDFDVCIEDIAHSLALTTRFRGMCRVFYSVAEHSVRVMELIDRQYPVAPRKVKLWALLHDAHEAYSPFGDVPRPLKRFVPDINLVHGQLDACIGLAFGIERSTMDDPAIKWADNVLLATEARDLMASDILGSWTQLTEPPLPDKVEPWSWDKAEVLFLRAFEDLS